MIPLLNLTHKVILHLKNMYFLINNENNYSKYLSFIIYFNIKIILFNIIQFLIKVIFLKNKIKYLFYVSNVP
jgi:hypothetical protein